MKKLFLFFAILSVFPARSQTFVYHPFPESNATWNVNMNQAMCFMGGSASEDYSITFSGDTTIANLTYQKLMTPFVQVSLGWGCIQMNFPGYQGAIRQDVAGKKVYYVPPSQLMEQLLYDFSMEVGDTVKGYLESFDQPDIVTEMDSVLVGDHYRKRWLINPCYEIYLIEGIGSTYGLLKPSPGCLTDMDYYSLSCFIQNGQTLYPDQLSECRLITSTHPVDIASAAVGVYPNPSQGSFTIDIRNHKNIEEIRLTDRVGSIVYQKKNMDQQTVNISGLPGGAYILTIIDKENRTTNRKIISCP